MRTATLTFHAPNNNGSFLQAYALQKVLADCMQVENEIIDFCTEKQEHQYRVLRKIHSVGDAARNMVSLLHYKDLRKRYRRFDEMRKTCLKMTPRCREEQEALQTASGYDLLICGSDQIWNTDARDFSDAYLLSGVPNRKITYAVSCGSELAQTDCHKLQKAAKEFEHLSVREQTTYDFLKAEGNKDIALVLDPTLLLEEEDYSRLYTEKPLIKEPYLLLYTINYSDDALQMAANLGEKYGLSVYTPFTGYSAVKCRKYGIRVLYDIAPDGFLNLVKYATYTCSNSFHGIAFSILFRKNFFRLWNLDENGNVEEDERIDGLLKQLGLERRGIHKRIGLDTIETVVDYKSAKEKLEILRKHSLDYLQNAIADERGTI